MKLELITEGLLQLLKENNYNPNTIVFYEREWKRLRSFLMREYGDSEFDMERGLLYLEPELFTAVSFSPTLPSLLLIA